MNTTPQRIQLRRTKGWRKPEGAIVVSRPSRWGNPWAVVPTLPRMPFLGHFDVIHRERYSSLGRFDDDLSNVPGTGARYWAAKGYGLHLQENPDLRAAAIEELRGHDLACWCPLDAPCHADVLLDLVNRPSET